MGLLEKKDHIKYLGIILDYKLTWSKHIIDLKERCQKRHPILRSVANRKWGADRKILKTLYLALIQSTINYASFLYGTSSEKQLLILNRIQY